MHTQRWFSRVGFSIFLAAVGAALVLGLASNRQQALAASSQKVFPVTTTIQAAINLASDGDIIDIPAGTYHESLSVYKTITLRGVSSDTTILESLPGQRAIFVASPRNLSLTNLTIRNGQPVNNMGGGVYLENGSLTMESCQVLNNSASSGGGIFQGGAASDVRISNSLISGNRSDLHGGGLQVFGRLWITDTMILGNTASQWGGGMYVNSSPAILNNVVLAGNAAGNSGGGLFTQGPLVVSNSRFAGNQALAAHGGGIYAVSGPLAITNTEILSNSAALLGGGIYFFNSNLQLSGSQIKDNNAWSGGGLYIDWQASAGLSRNKIFNNSAGRNGGGVFIANQSTLSSTNNILAGNQASWQGTDLWISNSQAILLHDTVVGSPNSAPGVAGISLMDGSGLTATNLILSDHPLGLGVETGSTANLDGLLLYDNDQESVGGGTINLGAHILRGNPLFRDPAQMDYHLLLLSPARDAGLASSLTTDIDGEGRPEGAGADIGADEIHYFPVSGLQASSDAPTVLGSATTFTASLAGGTEAVYSWDFGDGSPVQAVNPVTHVYTAVGKYTVTVRASNQLNQLEAELEIEVRPVPTPPPGSKSRIFLPFALRGGD